MMSIRPKPLCLRPALRIGTSCALSPEKLRATNVAPSVSASSTGSIGGCTFASPFFDVEPMSADAENWPFVRPYTPLFSITYSTVSYTHLRAHETPEHLVCRL